MKLQQSCEHSPEPELLRDMGRSIRHQDRKGLPETSSPWARWQLVAWLVMAVAGLPGCPSGGHPVEKADIDGTESVTEVLTDLVPLDRTTEEGGALDIEADGFVEAFDLPPEVPDVTELDAEQEILLSSCPSSFESVELAISERTSSLIRCYYPETLGDVPAGTYEGCPPFEFCHKGHKPDPVGDFVCYRECSTDAPCPGELECLFNPIPDAGGDQEISGCQADATSLPSYPEFGGQPAEGGLGCWTPVVSLGWQPTNARMAIVGNRAYGLFWEWWINEDGTGDGWQTLVTFPATAPVPGQSVQSLVERSASEVVWTRVRSSGSHLIVFQRDAPDPLTPWSVPDETVLSLILSGIPDPQGNVELKDSGLRVNLNGDFAAPVAGSQQGCVLYRRPTDLSLLCFPEVDGALQLKEVALDVPSGILSYFDWVYDHDEGYSPYQTENWTVALSDGWLAIVVGDACPGTPGRALHYRHYDQTTATFQGEWNTRKLTGVFENCVVNEALALSGDTLWLDGATSRLGDEGLSSWLLGTRFPPGSGDVLAWETLGAYLWVIRLHPEDGHKVWVNRINW